MRDKKYFDYTMYMWRRQAIDFLLIFGVIVPITGTALAIVCFWIGSMINDAIYH